jgi:hypothetical protein
MAEEPMTNEEETKAATAARDARIARIFDLALELTLERLENVDPKEKRDSMAFDRVARTAQVFVRLAHEAHALAAQNRKENAAHDESGDVRLPDDSEIDKLERALNQRLARPHRGQEYGAARQDAGKSGADPRDCAGGIA